MYIIIFSLGLIALNTKVDYELVTEFQFIVLAIDNAGGTQLTGTTTVTVVVEDTNEHSPEFVTILPPMPEIDENTIADQLVLQVGLFNNYLTIAQNLLGF